MVKKLLMMTLLVKNSFDLARKDNDIYENDVPAEYCTSDANNGEIIAGGVGNDGFCSHTKKICLNDKNKIDSNGGRQRGTHTIAEKEHLIFVEASEDCATSSHMDDQFSKESGSDCINDAPVVSNKIHEYNGIQEKQSCPLILHASEDDAGQRGTIGIYSFGFEKRVILNHKKPKVLVVLKCGMPEIQKSFKSERRNGFVKKNGHQHEGEANWCSNSREAIPQTNSESDRHVSIKLAITAENHIRKRRYQDEDKRDFWSNTQENKPKFIIKLANLSRLNSACRIKFSDEITTEPGYVEIKYITLPARVVSEEKLYRQTELRTKESDNGNALFQEKMGCNCKSYAPSAENRRVGEGSPEIGAQDSQAQAFDYGLEPNEDFFPEDLKLREEISVKIDVGIRMRKLLFSRSISFQARLSDVIQMIPDGKFFCQQKSYMYVLEYQDEVRVASLSEQKENCKFLHVCGETGQITSDQCISTILDHESSIHEHILVVKSLSDLWYRIYWEELFDYRFCYHEIGFTPSMMVEQHSRPTAETIDVTIYNCSFLVGENVGHKQLNYGMLVHTGRKYFEPIVMIWETILNCASTLFVDNKPWMMTFGELKAILRFLQDEIPRQSFGRLMLPCLNGISAWLVFDASCMQQSHALLEAAEQYKKLNKRLVHHKLKLVLFAGFFWEISKSTNVDDDDSSFVKAAKPIKAPMDYNLKSKRFLPLCEMTVLLVPRIPQFIKKSNKRLIEKPINHDVISETFFACFEVMITSRKVDVLGAVQIEEYLSPLSKSLMNIVLEQEDLAHLFTVTLGYGNGDESVVLDVKDTQLTGFSLKKIPQRNDAVDNMTGLIKKLHGVELQCTEQLCEEAIFFKRRVHIFNDGQRYHNELGSEFGENISGPTTNNILTLAGCEITYICDISEGTVSESGLSTCENFNESGCEWNEKLFDCEIGKFVFVNQEDFTVLTDQRLLKDPFEFPTTDDFPEVIHADNAIALERDDSDTEPCSHVPENGLIYEDFFDKNDEKGSENANDDQQAVDENRRAVNDDYESEFKLKTEETTGCALDERSNYINFFCYSDCSRTIMTNICEEPISLKIMQPPEIRPSGSMKDKLARRLTFASTNSRFQWFSADKFADAGFYVFGGNIVACYSCRRQHNITTITGFEPADPKWHNFRCETLRRAGASICRLPDVESDGRISDDVGDAPGQQSIYIPPGDIRREDYRLSTFEKFPVTCPISRKSLSRSGFYFTGFFDRVKCFACGRTVEQWEATDNPAELRWHKPSCPFPRGEECGNIPIINLFGATPTSRQGTEQEENVLEQRDTETGALIRRIRYPTNLPERIRRAGGTFEIGEGNSVVIRSGPGSQTNPVVRVGNESVHQQPVRQWRMANVTSADVKRFLENLHLNRELDRVASFARWPVSRPNISPAFLAKSGFFYLGDMDRTQCFSCGGVLRHWTVNDDAFAEHRTHFPQCRMIRHMEPRNVIVPEHPETQQERETNYPCRFPVNPHMRSEAARLETFDQRWPTGRTAATPAEIAQAGFFYLGERDRVKCWYCNGGLQNWEYDDIPWVEHAKWFPVCQFLLKVKGQHFSYRHLTLHPHLARPIIGKQRGSPLDPASQEQASGSQDIPPSTPGARAPTPPPTIIDPREEMQKRKERVKNAMKNSEVVKNVLTMGFAENIVEALLEDRINSGTEANPDDIYASVVELLDDVMKKEEDMKREEAEATRNQPPANAAVAIAAAGPGSFGTVSSVYSSMPGASMVSSFGPAPGSGKYNVSYYDEDEMMDQDMYGSETGLPSVISSATPAKQVSGAEDTPESLQEALDKIEEERMCKICFTNRADMVFLPCRHMCCCMECTQSIRHCPVCRKRIESAIKTYTS